MGACEDLGKNLGEMRARLTRGLLATASQGQEPPADFAQRVLAALPASRLAGAADPDLWRLSWRLVPAFAATVAMLLILFQFEGGIGSMSVSLPPGLVPGLVPEEGLSVSERLVLGATPQDPDVVLTAVMEGDRR